VRVKSRIALYLEIGTRRIFAGALDWPGWCRSGRDEESALETLAEYTPRYAAAVSRARAGFTPPMVRAPFHVVERVKGNPTTDFGAPGVPPRYDAEPVKAAELKRLATVLGACWTTFDEIAKSRSRAKLSTGPRGGGRSLAKIVAHVLEAEGAYLRGLGGKYRARDGTASEEMRAMRAAFLEMLEMRAAGETPPMGRRTAPLWSPRYAVRRSAWHALDHAWEIEDRAGP